VGGEDVGVRVNIGLYISFGTGHLCKNRNNLKDGEAESGECGKRLIMGRMGWRRLRLKLFPVFNKKVLLAWDVRNRLVVLNNDTGNSCPNWLIASIYN